MALPNINLEVEMHMADIDKTIADPERFMELADRWERETAPLSTGADEHLAYQEIIAMGYPAVPLIMERMKS